MSTVARWRTYWENKSLAGFRYENEDHYQRCAAELRVLFHSITPSNVLEIGCGNGVLYEHLGFDRCRYRGIDFSQSMLNVFQKNYPNVDLVCADGSTYRDDNKYDLIFSNGVLQHFDRHMLAEHFTVVREMMAPGALFVCASIPWRALWFRYLTGELTGGEQPHIFRAVVYRLLRAFSQDNMGYWYEHKDFRRLAERSGMTCSFHGSIHYPYRFHAVLRLKNSR